MSLVIISKNSSRANHETNAPTATGGATTATIGAIANALPSLPISRLISLKM
ncbi:MULTISPECIES: hypothetical protein [Okeania]|uniref:hypothetical protein n=1 Tax=Okeania TaxID=1458928 RepID=UPI001374B824|nr:MULTISPECIES: hypothetical protein [Okeania]NES77722.1 hypothetical protein [Okeania sp. SIO1H4]NET13772.1 hypothetical protein [Okeania sp. SIO1H6]NES88844.1 hypothetical protein [Okeania sp. SIO2B9]NET21352.1 hypothetical protein [Okeania sp. SIO1H5]NET78043.1 hypothetical protein [Okeania sp. SIO1F9]